jgi:hypothetical protein
MYLSPMPHITRGRCHVFFAFEIARSIDLDACERALRDVTARQRLRQTRRAPQSFQYRPAPLRVRLEAEAVTIGPWTTQPGLDAVLFDFGAISVAFTLSLEGPLETLAGLSEAVSEHAVLRDQAREHVRGLMDQLGTALERPALGTLVEDYLVFQIDTFAEPLSADALCREEAPVIACILRSSATPLSGQEIEDVGSSRVSYAPGDATVVDWNAALIYDPDGDESRAILEFANVQLLEMRHLDEELDLALERAYQALSHRPGFFTARAGELAWVGEMQVDAALLFERVTNALKLFGDQFLGRLYRTVSHRFHLADWDASIARKLETIQNLYQKLFDRASARRMEVLEWIIIILIAVSIVLSVH